MPWQRGRRSIATITATTCYDGRMPVAFSYSPIAALVAGVRDPSLGIPRDPWGYLLHTTGGGVTDQARREHRDPLEVAIATYIASQNGSNGYKWGGPGYVIPHDGSIHQLAPDNIETEHAGGPHREEYLSREWEHDPKIKAPTVEQWHRRWPFHPNPYSLFPSHRPNVDYVGCEMIPIGDGFGGEPMRPGLRFTKAQHDAAIALGRDLGARHGWPAGWSLSSRLVGHEDVDPIERSDAGGGWDPGWLRASPYFDFQYVRDGIAQGTP